VGVREPTVTVPVVALCGIDGAGKTSTCLGLGRDAALAGAAIVAKRDRRDAELLGRLFPEAESSPEGLLHGPYAQAVRWAHALDFLRFYEQEVVSRSGRTWLVISDRWTVCSVAYADVGTGLGEQVAAVLAPCRPADLVVHLDVDPHVAVRRIGARGDGKPDEALPILQRYREAYERWLPRLGGEVVRIAVDERSADEVGALVRQAILARFRPPVPGAEPVREEGAWVRSPA
jgi:thymidylate kinase